MKKSFQIIPFLLFCLIISACRQTNEELLSGGLELYHRKNYDAAVKVFSRVIGRDKNLQEAYYNRAFSFWQLQKKDSALRDFTTVLDLHMFEN